ncbi:MAG: YibE/F family protein [Euzebya sp.]
MTTLKGRQRALSAFVVSMIVLTGIGVAVLYPYGGPPEAAQQGFSGDEERFTGKILAVREVAGAPAEFLLPGAIEVSVDVVLDDGRRLTIDTVDETGSMQPGKPVLVAQISAGGTAPQFAIVDFQRGVPLSGLVVLFAVAVVALGRWQGVRALVGLGVSAVLIIGFLVPALLSGMNSTLVALVTALAVMFVTLPLSHGWGMTTKAAAAGTAVALLVTVGLAVFSGEATSLTGLTSEDVQFVRFATGQEIDVRGLFLAGVIVGTLGVLDDVTVSQAATVAALRRANPLLGQATVFAEALRVGRDHIAATVNTLFLAYVGAALPLLILFSIGDAPIGETLTSELVAQEIVRTMVGSIGLILAVPLTTAVAALTVDGQSASADGHAHLHHPPKPSEPVDMPVPAIPHPIAIDADQEQVAAQEWETSLRRSYGLRPPESDQ